MALPGFWRETNIRQSPAGSFRLKGEIFAFQRVTLLSVTISRMVTGLMDVGKTILLPIELISYEILNWGTRS